MIDDCDFLAPQMVEDPHPYLHRLRAEDPVHWSRAHRAWVLTRYDDVSAAFLDPKRLSSRRIGSLLPTDASAQEQASFDPIYRLLGNWMVFQDPPVHARLRRLARAAFSGRMVARLRPEIERLVDEMIGRVERAGECDFMTEFAYPLPATVIAKLLGIPTADLERFRGWSEDIKPLVFGGEVRAARRGRAMSGLRALEVFLRALFERYQREPGDNLMTELGRAEEKGDVLSADEVTATCVLLLFAGHETTMNLLATSMLHLARHRDQRARIAAEPALAASAVEEMLRFDGPAKLMVRLADESFELRGKAIEKGQRVIVCQAAANRDPEVFADPDRIDVAREPNEHLGFGLGIHFCLGAPLARLEGEVALRELARRLPNLRVTTDAPRWAPNVMTRGLLSLPVAVA